MATVLCLNDFTVGFSDIVQSLRGNGYRVIAAADGATALEVASENPIDAVLLNCHHASDNAAFVTALRILQPRVAVIMISGYCGSPCHQLRLADACIDKGQSQTSFLTRLHAVICQRRYGLCRSLAA